MLTITIDCDECSEIGDGARYGEAKKARAALKKIGWLVGLRGGRDLCPSCAKRLSGQVANGAHQGARP